MAVVCLVAATVHAQVYRCMQQGRPVFTDMACPEGGAPVNTGAAGPNGALDFQVVTRHYDVTGPNLQSAWMSMRARGPMGGFAGMARWKVEWSIQQARSGAGCSVAGATVRVVGDILMPHWLEEGRATPAEQLTWRTMYANLKRHEDGHIQHGREFAQLLKERLLGMGVQPCDRLESQARQEYERLYDNLHRRDADYDRRTDHGLRQDNPR